MKFTSKPIPEDNEVPLPDDGRLEDIVDYWSERDAPAPSSEEGVRNACYVVSVGSVRDPLVRQSQLAEILNLVRTQGDAIVGEEIYHLSKPNPRTLLGKGAAQEMAARARACGANLLVLDAELTPSQMRNLEDTAGIAICDREAVILNVFLLHAKTRRARIQVEIAQMEYLRPRIRGVGINMDQQTGGVKGGRGPGETASELLARKLDSRLAALTKALRKLESEGKTQRRDRESCERIVLVGYTNAGKTSLMNALTDAGLSARNMPFETLDTTSRSLSRHGGEVLLSDTVGFIRRLPERLFASFESTLTEICDASLLVLVVDASDYERELHLETTVSLLDRLGASEVPRLYVFNKVDRLPIIPGSDVLNMLSGGHPHIALSSADKTAVLQLKDALLDTVRRSQETEALFVPYAASEVLSIIYGRCRVISTDATAEGLTLSIQGGPQVIAHIKRKLEELSR